MNKINCSIITDILPLYIDDVVSIETKVLVAEHISHCESCKKELEKLSQNAVMADNVAVRLNEAKPLRSFKKRIWQKRTFLVFAVLIFFLLMTVPMPIRVNRTLNGICWETNDGTAEECTITVEGWYYRYLLKENIFKGDIRFSSAGGTVSYHAPNAALYRSPMYGDRGGEITVYDPARNQMRSLGYIAVSGNFQKISIYSHSEQWHFSAPAGDYSEAVELAGKQFNYIFP